MKIRHKYIEEHKLFIIKWMGKWDVEEYKKSMNNFVEITETVNVEKVIHDITDLDFDIKILDINQLAKMRNEKIKKTYKTVYITRKPKDVVFSYLYSEEVGAGGGSYKHCRTTLKAIDLLSLKISNTELKKSFSQLKNSILKT